MKLLEIPIWMEGMILRATGGEYESVEKLKNDSKKLADSEPDLIERINIMIEVILLLDSLGHIRRVSKKQISDVLMGEIFKIYPEQERYYIKSSTENVDGFYRVREFQGGRGFKSIRLSEPGYCHDDIEVTIVPSFPEVF
jgi:hypothetical protein